VLAAGVNRRRKTLYIKIKDENPSIKSTRQIRAQARHNPKEKQKQTITHPSPPPHPKGKKKPMQIGPKRRTQGEGNGERTNQQKAMKWRPMTTSMNGEGGPWQQT
jgi:hypothetical protein